MFQDDSYLNYYKQILSTFKFTQPQSGSRILLTPEVYQEIYNNSGQVSYFCNDDTLDSSEPDQIIDYVNQAKGISLKIPYNQKWGDAKYQVAPYDETTGVIDLDYNTKSYGSISFGRAFPFEGCGLAREMNINFITQKPADQIIKDMNAADNPLLPTPPHKVTIDGLSAVEYEDVGLCSYPTVIIIGQKFNYLIGQTCGDSFKPEEDIAKTIKLIN